MGRLIWAFAIHICPKIGFRIASHRPIFHLLNLLFLKKVKLVNPCPAEPGYALPLQTVENQISWLLQKNIMWLTPIIWSCGSYFGNSHLVQATCCDSQNVPYFSKITNLLAASLQQLISFMSKEAVVKWSYHLARVLFCFVLRFYGPVKPMGSCQAWSVYLTTFTGQA